MGRSAPFSEADPPPPDPTAGPAARQVALAGKDGRQAAGLLESTKAAGVRLLAAVASSALARLLRDGGAAAVRRARRLLDDAEREALAAGFAAALATGDLLGRARIRLRARQAEARHAAGGTAFSEEPTDFHVFAGGLRPMPPNRAAAHFNSLVPELNADPKRLAAGVRRQAFTLAAATDEETLGRVKDVIARRLETGRGVGTAADEIRAVLDEAGVTPASPGYADNVWRTNAMDAYTTGSMDELQEQAETFPVWKFVGIRDGRQRPSHEVHFDRYFPTSMTFAQVRDSVKGSFDGFQCRCNLVPVDRWEWADLFARGVRLTA